MQSHERLSVETIEGAIVMAANAIQHHDQELEKKFRKLLKRLEDLEKLLY